MKHRGTIELESKRLILRRFKIEDAPAVWANWANDPEVTKYLSWPPHEYLMITENVISDWVDHYYEKDFYTWAIILKTNGNNPIGSIGVVRKNDQIKMVDIGYCIGRKWWHQGIVSEAFEMIIEFLFNEVQVNRIEARHDPRNSNSGKVMLKCGLKYEGTLRDADQNNQGICDASYYAILARDYEAKSHMEVSE